MDYGHDAPHAGPKESTSSMGDVGMLGGPAIDGPRHSASPCLHLVMETRRFVEESRQAEGQFDQVRSESLSLRKLRLPLCRYFALMLVNGPMR